MAHNPNVADDLSEDRFACAYAELRRVAACYLRHEREDHTLQPTALVHEAFLRLNGSATAVSWQDQNHFVACAARAMRRVLVDHARRWRAAKRQGTRVDWTIAALPQAEPMSAEDFLALDAALRRLAGQAPNGARHVRLVELVWLGGMDVTAAAAQLGISRRQAHRDWAWARTWLRRELGHG